MSLLINIAIIAFFVAQFTPRGQAFLATDNGSLAVVVLAVIAVGGMLPGAMLGDVVSVIMIAVWAWIAYPRLGAAGRGMRKLFGARG